MSLDLNQTKPSFLFYAIALITSKKVHLSGILHFINMYSLIDLFKLLQFDLYLQDLIAFLLLSLLTLHFLK